MNRRAGCCRASSPSARSSPCPAARSCSRGATCTASPSSSRAAHGRRDRDESRQEGADMNEQVTVGLVQMSMGEDREANVEKAFGMARAARERGAELIVFPELFNGIYF